MQYRFPALKLSINIFFLLFSLTIYNFHCVLQEILYYSVHRLIFMFSLIIYNLYLYREI